MKNNGKRSTFCTSQHFILHVHLLTVIVQHHLKSRWKKFRINNFVVSIPTTNQTHVMIKVSSNIPIRKVYWIVSRHSNRSPSIMYTDWMPFPSELLCLFVCVCNEIQECEDNDFFWKSLGDILRLDGSFTFYSSDCVTNLNDIKLCSGWFDLTSPWLSILLPPPNLSNFAIIPALIALMMLIQFLCIVWKLSLKDKQDNFYRFFLSCFVCFSKCLGHEMKRQKEIHRHSVLQSMTCKIWFLRRLLSAIITW